MRDERQKGKIRTQVGAWPLNGDTEGSSRSCRSSSRGCLIPGVSKQKQKQFGVYMLVDPDCIPKSAALQQVEQQWTTSSVCSLTDMLVTKAGYIGYMKSAGAGTAGRYGMLVRAAEAGGVVRGDDIYLDINVCRDFERPLSRCGPL